jgi:hypothetical protein
VIEMIEEMGEEKGLDFLDEIVEKFGKNPIKLPTQLDIELLNDHLSDALKKYSPMQIIDLIKL